MKLIAVLVTAVTLANATPFPAAELEARDCTANNCLRAIRGSPEDVANAFCSTVLGKVPATDAITVTATATVTAFTTVVETATQHQITGTVTITPPVAALNKRKTTAYSEYTSKFTSMCSSEQAKITSACGCYLSGAPTSTVTVYETVSATYTETTVTSTSTSTLTIDDIATATYVCVPLPTNHVQNGDFEQDIGSDSPWTVSYTDGTAHSSYGIVRDTLSHGDATRVFRSSFTNYRYSDNAYAGVQLDQTISTCPGTKYTISWDIRATDYTYGYAFAFAGGNLLSQIGGLPSSNYGNYKVSFTATDYTTVVAFKALEVFYGSGKIFFDNISVTPDLTSVVEVV